MGDDKEESILSLSNQGSWEDNDVDSLRLALLATPSQRIQWLEQAIELAYQAGALKTLDKTQE